MRKIEERLESLLNTKIKDLPQRDWSVFLNLVHQIVPRKSSLKRRTILNVFMLDAITSYRGWRHYKGLPVRGQRT
jgi:Ribosomal protein S13